MKTLKYKQKQDDLPFRPISLQEAMKLSDGYFSSVESIRNVICRGRLTRYGAPKRAELNYYEFMIYIGRPA